MTNTLRYPQNPTIGQEYPVGDTIKVWDGAKWVNKNNGGYVHTLRELEADIESIDDYLELKVFQSPTETGLTEITTRLSRAGEVYEVRKVSDGSLATIYADVASATEIIQNGTNNVADSNSNVKFYIATGSYYLFVGSVRVDFNVDEPFSGSVSANEVSTNTSDTAQDFIDSFALKIFQSPTDGGLTEIQTRTVNANEVYEVRKTSDDSLAIIYSDAAGTTEIVQDGTSNVSGSDGVVEFYTSDGGYYVDSGSVKSSFDVMSEIQSRQAIEAVYKAQGYNNIFFFEDGFTYTEPNDVGIYEDGTGWIYVGAGAPNKVVEAGTAPSVGEGYTQVTFNSSGYVSVNDYMPDTTGVLDGYDAFNSAYEEAIATGKGLTWHGVIRLNATFSARFVEINAPSGEIVMSAGESFIIGGNASTTDNKPQTIYQIRGDDHDYDYDTDSGTPACIIKGSKCQTINLAKCPYLLFYADTNSTVYDTDYSIAYSRFNFEYIKSIKFDTNPNTDGSDTQWINENEIKIMRCNNFVIDGSYPHNNNRVVGGTFEGKKYIDLRVGTCNRFRDIRFEAYGENIPTVKFGEGVRSCTVVTSWHSSPPYANSMTASVEDNGYNNSVHNEYYEHAYLAFSDSLSLDDGFISDGSNGLGRKPSLYSVNGGFGAWYKSQLIPVNNSRVEVRSIGGDNRKFRFYINFFDAEGRPYVGTSDSFLSSTSTLNGDGTGTVMGTGSSGGYIQLIDPNIFFIELVVIGSFSQVSQEYQDIKYIGMQVWSMHDKSDYKNIIDSTRLNEILVSAPTLGFARVGRVVETDEAQYKCAYSKRSTLVSVSGSTITFEDIGDTSAIKAGAIIGIPTYEGRSTQWAKVLTVNSSTSITIDAPVDANYWIGSDIAIVVWHASQYKVGISMTSNLIDAGKSRAYVTTLNLLEDVGSKSDGGYSVQPWTCLTTIDKQVTSGLIVQSVITDVNEVTTTFYNITDSSIRTESYWKPILTLSKR